MKIIKSLLIAPIVIPALCFGEASNFNLLQAEYINQNIDISVSGTETQLDFDGYRISGSAEITETFFVLASYSDVSLDEDVPGLDVDSDDYSIGAGYVFGSNQTGTVFGHLEYVDASADASGGGLSASADEDGYRVGAGVRVNLSERTEVNAGLSYIELGDSGEASVSAGIVFEFFKSVSGVASVTHIDGDTSAGFGARFSF